MKTIHSQSEIQNKEVVLVWEKPVLITESFEETMVPKSPNSAEGATYHS